MPLTAIHPGEHLAEELKALGMSAAELASQLKVPTNRITEILNGQRAITGDTRLTPGPKDLSLCPTMGSKLPRSLVKFSTMSQTKAHQKSGLLRTDTRLH